jgi:hypothetical protein
MPKTLPVTTAPPTGGVGRRRVLQGLLTGVGAGFSVPGLAASHPLATHAQHPERIAEAQARAERGDAAELLDAYQMRALESLGERIVPGAQAAGCARFIDSLLAAGAADAARRFVTALGAIDAEARERHGLPWADLETAQQVGLLEAASSASPGAPTQEPWTPGTSVADYLAAQGESFAEPRRVTLRDHFDEIKGWVVGAYYSSELGLYDLGYMGSSMGAPFQPCVHPDGHRKA